VLFDQKPWQEWDRTLQAEIKSLELNFIFGPDAFLELTGFDVAFRSPGIKLSELKNFEGLVTSQTKFFFDNCPCKIIGVTGTKGKGTTASLIYEILQANSHKLKIKSYLTGNIGEVQPFEILETLKPSDWIVYELSSFQLQDLEKSPHIGVALMVTSEHLDYHKDLNEYIEAKTTIVKYQKPNDFAVINADFSASKYIGSQGLGQKVYFSRQNNLEAGVFVLEGSIQVKNVCGQSFQFPVSNLKLRGKHNLENVCAATAAAVCAGSSEEAILTTIRNFKGLEHRLEFVVEKNGVQFYNDSFSTTPETAIAAINSFSEPLVLILGGSSKNSDFSELGKTIQNTKNIKAIILIGEEAEKLKAKIKNNEQKFQLLEGAINMANIFDQIKSVVKKGDAVLLSPACASFDMFKNYKDRGEQFKIFSNNFSIE
jgi:UDP-N-acetylmuramoylalanine--D-glutamate ligase